MQFEKARTGRLYYWIEIRGLPSRESPKTISQGRVLHEAKKEWSEYLQNQYSLWFHSIHSQRASFNYNRQHLTGQSHY